MNGKSTDNESEVREEHDLRNGSPIRRVEYRKNNSREALTLYFADGSQGQVSRESSEGNLSITLLDHEKGVVPDTAEGPRLDYILTNIDGEHFNFHRDVPPLIRTAPGRRLMDAYIAHLRQN